MLPFVSSLDELERCAPRHVLLLYSGGVDGTYLLQWLAHRSIEVTALQVRFGDAGEVDSDLAKWRAAKFGASLHTVDASREFFTDFLPAAIHADAYYQGQFPVGSTLTRPLMAKVAVDAARQLGCDAVAHTATYTQNSSLRLSGSIAALDRDIVIAAPFLGSQVPRDVKVEMLREAGITFETGIYSVDANPWARVIESGPLENPEDVLDETVFTLTRDIDDCPDGGVEIDIAFHRGLPSEMDGQAMALSDLVSELNELGGLHGVGRFSGLEDLPFGVKNHEVREAPAAALITTAHRALANAVFGMREHTIRATLGQEWTNLVVHGGWYGHLAQSLAQCLAKLDEPLTGTVRLRVARGTMQVLRLRSEHGLYYSRFREEFDQWMSEYSYGPWLTHTTITDTVRTGRNGR
ncbi:argininosuccinate synthase domain-containing protein [Pseudonocardia sp. CA-142604]|uniref:argininosuccinate synthase domain-containing protein n=1 Tax=Pseudonocardia sp. CA-142604 TaxID=3240024 RepID=UPI003D8EF66E